MQFKKRITAAAAIALSVGSLALASDAVAQAGKMQSGREWTGQHETDHAHDQRSMSRLYDEMDRVVPSAASSCPKLEGYPDCH